MSGRGVSTVLDVTLAILIVGAAVVTVVRVPPTDVDDRGTDAADETAQTLAGTTADVEYTLAPGARRADPSLLRFPEDRRSGPRFRREAHGTVAALLARAATRNVSVDGSEISHAGDDLRRGVANATLDVVREGDVAGQVVATWRPFRGSEIRGRVVVGPAPPTGVEVHAATVNVTSRFPEVRERARSAAPRGYDAVARVVASGTVRGLFPPERTRLALQGTYPRSALVTYRYRHAAELLDTSVVRAVAASDVQGANARLARSLAGRFEQSLRRTYPTARAAARNVSVGTVTLTVRTWSR